MFSLNAYRPWHLLSAALLLSPTLSAPSAYPLSSASMERMGDCIDYQIPVTTRTEAQVWGLPKFSSNFDVSAFILSLIRRTTVPPTIPFNPFKGTRNVTGNYTIGATFCSPKNASKGGHEKTVLLATHGLGYDRRYWIPTFNTSEYSFAEYAVSKGYSVFMYDRVGTGKSSRVSGYTESQSSNHLAILASLTKSVRSGQYTGNLGQPSKVVHVGHSFGSILTHTLVEQDPTLSDGIILTGTGYNETAFPSFFEGARLNIANTVSPGKYRGLDSGYLAFADIYGNVATFFNPADFDPEALWYTQHIAQPLAAIELLPAASGNPGATNFTGPVMILTGEIDLGNCAGNCNGLLEHPAREIFRKAEPFKTAVHPRAGHGINFNPNATGAFGVMTDFLAESGL
ncbi:hypothetical protein PG993_015044 [Apiospora rasikravindrae]|uniref:AB hydrolase-1 domain-containing protein n=1 Tax=Apiospora rasikravindrae TaxID=990691 RepID=A0ABR1RPJ2_9PEZI